jgi:hypothetical protein
VDIISDLSPVWIQTSATLPPVIKDEAYAVTLMVTGGVEPYNWFVASGSLPPGLSLDATGAISGTPTQVGVSVFTAEVFDSLGRGTQRTFTLEIRNAILVITTTSPLPDGAVGSELKITFAATGGAQPYTWSLNGGALPTGTTLAATGELTGIPTAVGGFTFTIQVTEAAKATLRKNFSITIKPPLIEITTGATLPAGSEGSFYSVAFAAEGGSQPYRWDAAGAPAGLNMNATTGVLSGTAGTAGTVDFSVQVADKSGTSQTKIFSVSLDKKLAVTTVSLPPGSVGVLYAQQLGAGGGAPPYAWSVANGTLQQTSAIGATSEGGIGTFALYTQGNWTNYRATFTLKSSDDDTIGVMFRYKDSNNYYRFSWDKQKQFRRLEKRVNGTFTTLASDTATYVVGQAYQVKIVAQGTQIQVIIDGQQVFSVTDSAQPKGTIALYSRWNIGAMFDNILVEDLQNSAILLWDNFNAGDFIGWTIIDDAGTSGGPSHWSVTSGTLMQSVNIGSDATGNLGTFLLY